MGKSQKAKESQQSSKTYQKLRNETKSKKNKLKNEEVLQQLLF